jgi:hypothetical protein
METLKDKILKEYEQGNIIVATHEGLASAKLEDIVKQPVDGLLYDLNRDEATILTFVEDPKWVNDYALSQVVRVLHNKVAELESKKVVHIAMFHDLECSNQISVHETADGAANACHEHRKGERKKWHADTRRLYDFMMEHGGVKCTLPELRQQRPFMSRDSWGVYETEVLK